MRRRGEGCIAPVVKWRLGIADRLRSVNVLRVPVHYDRRTCTVVSMAFVYKPTVCPHYAVFTSCCSADNSYGGMFLPPSPQLTRFL